MTEGGQDAGKGTTQGGCSPGCLWTLVAIAVFAVVATVLSSAGGDDEADSTSDEATAIEACENSVEEQLKAPATAQFSDETASPLGTRRYRVTGAVDSENSFGALIRNRWTCVANPAAGGYRGVATFP